MFINYFCFKRMTFFAIVKNQIAFIISDLIIQKALQYFLNDIRLHDFCILDKMIDAIAKKRSVYLLVE